MVIHSSSNNNIHSNNDALGPFASALIIAALVSLVSTIICGVFFMDYLEDHGMTWVLIALFGLTFFLFGTAAFIGTRQVFTLIFILVGGILFGISLSYGIGSEELREVLISEVVPVLGSAVFPITGAGLCIGGVVSYRKKLAKYTYEVRAEVIDKQMERYTDNDYHTHRTYRLTWQYYINGQWITWRASSSRSPEPRNIGDRDVLFVDPVHQNEAFDKAMEKAGMRIMLGIGFAFIIIGTVTFIMVITNIF